MSTPIEDLKAVLCDPEGKCCITGSDGDRRVVDDALRELAAEPVVKESLKTQLAALTVRLETAELDAGRYRRLRAWRYELSAGLNFPDSETKWIDENDLDAAIDAAMKECGK